MVVEDNDKSKEQLLNEFSNLSHRVAELEKSEIDLKQKTALLRKLSADYQMVFDSVPAMIWQKDTQNNFIRANRSAAAALGMLTGEVEGRSAYDLFPDEAEKYYQDDLEVINSGLSKVGIVEKMQIAGGEKIWVQTDNIPIRDGKGNINGVLLFVVDITGRKLAEERLMESEERYRIAIEASNDGVTLLRDGLHIYVNRKFLEIYGYDKPEEALGKNLSLTVHPDDREMVTERNRKRQRGEQVPSKYEFKGIRKDGTPIYIEVSAAGVTFHGEPATLAYHRDITERKQLEETLKVLSITDELTELYNRRGFFVLSQQQLKLAERTRKSALLFFADLDKLKWINDTSGHQEGDVALLETAHILKDTFRETDVIGRLGGDEFAVLAIDTNDETEKILANRLQTLLSAYNELETTKYKISLSVGVAQYDHENPVSLDELITRADTLMYEEKTKKKHRN
ncbi:MAG: sensor domain-containing diguanylate cyclase [Proteobacteria bacterium]|nr:sensor domain-containing diguanylate cyclase [Pseudomonadota bacterium]